MSAEKLIEERTAQYGCFSGQAELSQSLKQAMSKGRNWGSLSAMQREALEMIAHKIARILNGDPNYDDSWLDIGGYANLPVVVKEKQLAWVESLRQPTVSKEETVDGHELDPEYVRMVRHDRIMSRVRELQRVSDAALERATGEPHINGWPLYSGLPEPTK